MFKVIVTNPNKLGSPFKGEFDTQELAQAWIESQLAKSNCPWGKLEHQVEDQPAVYDESGELISEATYITVPQEFEVEGPIDISAQVEQESINAESLAYLAITDWLIVRELETGVVCPEEIKNMRQLARESIIK